VLGLPQRLYEVSRNHCPYVERSLQTLQTNIGQPVNDQTVAAKIKNGGPQHAGYQYTLTEKDLADLVSFLREGKCCWEDFEEKEPPRNPRYKAK